VAALQSPTAPSCRHQRHRCGPAFALPALSSRELEVLQLLADGASNPDISKALFISRRTTEHHVEHILTKLGVTSRTAAVAPTPSPANCCNLSRHRGRQPLPGRTRSRIHATKRHAGQYSRAADTG
jgi:DNA-binding CsgD family transcriptional regulator